MKDRILNWHTLSRRDFIRLLVTSGVALVACQSRTEPVDTQEATNLAAARTILRDIGITTDFAQMSSKAIFEANGRLIKTHNLESQWVNFLNSRDELCALAIDDTADGEPMFFRRGQNGETLGFEGFGIGTRDNGEPKVLLDIKDGGRTCAIVGYGDTPKSSALGKYIQENGNAVATLLRFVFSHSNAPLNLLHLPTSGMPTVQFTHPDYTSIDQKPLDGITESPGYFIAMGKDINKYNRETGAILRVDVIINYSEIRNAAKILGFPLDALCAGMFVDESCGVAESAYRLPSKIARPALNEIGSSGARIAQTLLFYHNSEGPFFKRSDMDTIRDLVSAIDKQS